jgi:hypothetical protein
VQVGDRWHLWRNLCLAVDKCVARHRDSLREPPVEAQADPAPQPGSLEVSPRQESGLAIRTRQRYAEIEGLLANGVSRSKISQQLRLDPHTVRRFANATCVEELLTKTNRQSVLDEFKAYLSQRWNEGCTDGELLFREIAAQGFRGSVKTVRRFLQPFRSDLPVPASMPVAVKPRQGAGWIVTDPDNLTPEHRDRLQRLLDRSPALAAVAGHVREFAKMMKNLTGNLLQRWITSVLADDLPHALVRRRAATRPGRRHRRPHPRVELRARGGPCQPHQDDQAADVWPRELRPAAQASPARELLPPAVTRPAIRAQIG